MHRHPQFPAYAALVSVCFFWGTTYLGIRMALESFPPLTLVAIRFVLSGAILLLAAWWSGARLPRGRELWISAYTGIICLGGGNSCLTFAEQWIPSGLAALIISTSPFWLVGIESMMPRGERLHRPTVIGMVVGLAGAALLASPGAGGGELGMAAVHGFLVLQLGNALWAYGSIYQRSQPTEAHPVVTGAVQQLAAGLCFAVLALVIPQPAMHPTARGIGAIAYLVVFGSIVGYSSYVYAMKHLPVAIVSIYPYVNPVVAVILGWLFYREHFGLIEGLAMAVIFVGVWIVKRYTPGAHQDSDQPAEASTKS